MSRWKDIGVQVAKIGAPLLGFALGGPAGAGVASAIAASALGTDNTPDAIGQALVADPDAAMKLRQAELENARELRAMTLQAQTNQLAEINATMRAEQLSEDAYVRRWRPTFGYICALAWLVQFGAVAYVIVTDPAQAMNVIAAIGQLSVMWGVALAVLGVSISKRSADKAAAAGSPQAGMGLLGALAQRIAGGGK